MVAYENGKIYKIINENDEIIYIGSTTQSLAMRYSNHKHKSKNNKIILIEVHPCSSKEELLKKEQECMEQNKSCNLLNKYNAYMSDEDKKNIILILEIIIKIKYLCIINSVTLDTGIKYENMLMK